MQPLRLDATIITPTINMPTNPSVFFKAYSLLECPLIIDWITGRSWKASGPVSLQELTYLRLIHWNMQQKIQYGELIVHSTIATEVLSIFNELFDRHFPLHSVALIDYYFNADSAQHSSMNDQQVDERSMQDNNTSALFVRKKGHVNEWSHHATGKAIDINPLYNPLVIYQDNHYAAYQQVLPANGAAFVQRQPIQPGMISDSVVALFKRYGWYWGGDWQDADYIKDYQHFSKEARHQPIADNVPL